jgi:thiosulfate/3-mercaptopyruvate sulfurtransferase
LRLVISVDELHSMIEKGDRNLLVVDARSFAEYAQGHVPGAVNVDLMQFHWIDTSEEGIRQFNRQTRMLLSNIGVSSNKFVVFYDNVSGPSAARGVWLLMYFSHDKVAMLDGGIESWKALCGTETKTNRLRHAEFKGKPSQKTLAGYKAIKSAMKKKNAVILDARSKEEYDGTAIRAAQAGHIPNAINIDWNDNVCEQKFKDLNDLEKIYSKIPKGAEVITYCQGGYRAANSFVVLKMLGYENVRMYLGSWGEWGNKTGLPISR